MLGFSDPSHRSAVAIDVGSSSVGVAVVCMRGEAETETLWSHRENSLIHEDDTPEKHLKHIKTALTNAFLELNQSGLAALKNSEHDSNISEIQATIAAPFSYTITKTILLKDEHPFVVGEEMIAELVDSAKKQSKLVFATNKLAETLGLEITHGDVISVAINDYVVTDPIDQKGRKLSLTYLETAVAQEIIRTLQETTEKFFPKAQFSQYSFMYPFFVTLRNMYPNTTEACLIDITGEATEIGIVRDDALKHTSYAPAGRYSIAREVSKATGLPKDEVYGYMKDDFAELAKRLPEKTQKQLSKTLEAYVTTLVETFKVTGDKLTIPNTIFLHTDAKTESFFIELIKEGIKIATGKTPSIHTITPKALGAEEAEDTAILVASNFLVNKANYITILPKSD